MNVTNVTSINETYKAPVGWLLESVAPCGGFIMMRYQQTTLQPAESPENALTVIYNDQGREIFKIYRQKLGFWACLEDWWRTTWE